jgi:hypothetical protein
MSTASFPGTVVGTTVSEVRVTPVFTGCVLRVRYLGHHHDRMPLPVHNTDATGSTSHAAMHIERTGANKIKITPTFFGASVCTVEVGSQTPSGFVDLENKSSGGIAESHVLVTSTATGISHTAGCGASAASDGTYTGSVTEKGGGRIWVT